MDAGSGPTFLISLPSSTEQIRTTLFASPIAAWLPLPLRPSAITGWPLPAISLGDRHVEIYPELSFPVLRYDARL